MTKQREMNTTKGKLMRPLPRECGHFNTDKSHVLRVTRKQNPIIHDYTLHVKFLKLWTQYHLGVTLT